MMSIGVPALNNLVTDICPKDSNHVTTSAREYWKLSQSGMHESPKTTMAVIVWRPLEFARLGDFGDE
jgi:hypothetical protein